MKYLQANNEISEEEKKKLFNQLALMQRDKPERAMVRYQMSKVGVPILGLLLEHIGDLIHRMTEITTYDSGGHGYVQEKVKRGIHYLRNPSAFEREYESQRRDRASALGIPLEQYTKLENQLLKVYVDEHSKLPTYNRVQKLAQKAAVSLGLKDFDTTIDALLELHNYLGDSYTWIEAAHRLGEEPASDLSPEIVSAIRLLRQVGFRISAIDALSTKLDRIYSQIKPDPDRPWEEEDWKPKFFSSTLKNVLAEWNELESTWLKTFEDVQIPISTFKLPATDDAEELITALWDQLDLAQVKLEDMKNLKGSVKTVRGKTIFDMRSDVTPLVVSIGSLIRLLRDEYGYLK